MLRKANVILNGHKETRTLDIYAQDLTTDQDFNKALEKYTQIYHKWVEVPGEELKINFQKCTTSFSYSITTASTDQEGMYTFTIFYRHGQEKTQWKFPVDTLTTTRLKLKRSHLDKTESNQSQISN